MKISFITLIILVSNSIFAQKKTTYTVQLNKELSTPFFDFAPVFIDDNCNTLIFSSNRKQRTTHNGYPIYGVFYTSLNKSGKWNSPTAFDTLSSSTNNAVVSIDKKRKVIFLTKCPIDWDSTIGCNIHYSFMEGSLLGETLPLPLEHVKDRRLNIGQPSYSNEYDVLFFVANEWPGGYGGSDLWYSKYDRTTDSWQFPVNLGPEVNTQKDELYPNLHPDGTLYFTSDGHPGLGKWDLFTAQRKSDFSWGNVKNMGAPMNSKEEDFGITFRGKDNSGYFTSNRKGGIGGDDIYEFYIKGTKKLIPLNDSFGNNVTEDATLKSLELLFNKQACTPESEKLKISNVIIHPNPNKGEFTVELTTNYKSDLTLRLYSSTGRLITQENIKSDKGQLSKQYNLTNPVSGIYYLQVLRNCEILHTEKIVINQ